MCWQTHWKNKRGIGHFLRRLSDLSSWEVEQELFLSLSHTHTHTQPESQNPIMEVAGGKGYSSLSLSLSLIGCNSYFSLSFFLHPSIFLLFFSPLFFHICSQHSATFCFCVSSFFSLSSPSRKICFKDISIAVLIRNPSFSNDKETILFKTLDIYPKKLSVNVQPWATIQ